MQTFYIAVSENEFMYLNQKCVIVKIGRSVNMLKQLSRIEFVFSTKIYKKDLNNMYYMFVSRRMQREIARKVEKAMKIELRECKKLPKTKTWFIIPSCGCFELINYLISKYIQSDCICYYNGVQY